ncbi:MAG TPA: DUF2231 domain-containing protein [Candidatus Acidoferrales bacterium]|nr:DUF2231 domain-containing protein [Candidatus Acidoferrales bacterium]
METLFPGLSAMENIHPVFVHFPVVLLPLALVLQALAVWRRREDCQRAALWLLWLGTLGALAAAGTGLLAEEKVVVPEPGWEVIELHETLMLVATGLAAALSALAVVLRRRLTRDIQMLLLAGLLVLSGVLVVGADRGGQLVYQFGVSVQKGPTADRQP